MTENQADLATYNERTKAVVLQMAGDDKKTGPVRVELRLRLAYSTQAVAAALTTGAAGAGRQGPAGHILLPAVGVHGQGR